LSQKIVTCKVVTPMFSRGAEEPIYDKNANASVYPFELRPQSVKGVLRFWFRAVAPLVIDVHKLKTTKNDKDEKMDLNRYDQKDNNKTYNGLKLIESLIFGSQDVKAPFGLTVEWNDRGKPIGFFSKEDKKCKFFSNIFGTYNKNTEQANSQPKKIRFDNVNYALYGLYDSSSGNRRMYSFLPVNSTLNITFFIKDESVWPILQGLLKLVSVFSGFGAKTRKGFGEFEIIKITGDDGSQEATFSRDSFFCAKNSDEACVKKFINEVANSICKFAETYNERHKDSSFILEQTKFNDVPEFPNFTDNIIYVPHNLSCQSTKFLFERLYKTTKDHKGLYPQAKQELRKCESRDCINDLISALEGQKEKEKVKIPPTILGLPLQYYNLKPKKTKIKDFNKLKITIYSSLAGLADDETGRKASPLFVSIHRRNDKWFPVFLILPSQMTNKRLDDGIILEREVSFDNHSGPNNSNQSENKSTQCSINEDFTITAYEDFKKLKEILEKISQGGR